MTSRPADVVVDDLHTSYAGLEVLRGLHLNISAGSVTAVLGRSGSGKTTLLRVIAGFQRPDRGTVVVGGTILDDEQRHVRADRRRIGYVSQEGSLFPHLSVEANVGFGLPRSQRRGPRVGELLDAVGLTGLAARYPHQLSGGQQQRVALARALAVGSRVVLLDEPFNTLDAGLRSSVRADVHAIIRDAGATAILVTHDQDEALLMADRVAVIRGGTIAQFAAPSEVYDRPKDTDLARFIGQANVVDGTAGRRGVDTAFGTLTARGTPGPPPEGPVAVLVRPEQVEVRAGPREPGVRARVLRTDFHGSDTVISVAPEVGALPSSITARVLGNRELVPGEVVTVTVNGPVHVWTRAEAAPVPSNAPDRATAPAGGGSGATGGANQEDVERAVERDVERAVERDVERAVERDVERGLARRWRATAVWARVGIGCYAVLVLLLAVFVVVVGRSVNAPVTAQGLGPGVVGEPTTTAAGTHGTSVTKATGPTVASSKTGAGATRLPLQRCVDPDDLCFPAITETPGLVLPTNSQVAAIVQDVTPPPGQQIAGMAVAADDETWSVVYLASGRQGQNYVVIHVVDGRWTTVEAGYPRLPCDGAIPAEVLSALGSLAISCS